MSLTGVVIRWISIAVVIVAVVGCGSPPVIQSIIDPAGDVDPEPFGREIADIVDVTEVTVFRNTTYGDLRVEIHFPGQPRELALKQGLPPLAFVLYLQPDGASSDTAGYEVVLRLPRVDKGVDPIVSLTATVCREQRTSCEDEETGAISPFLMDGSLSVNISQWLVPDLFPPFRYRVVAKVATPGSSPFVDFVPDLLGSGEPAFALYRA